MNRKQNERSMFNVRFCLWLDVQSFNFWTFIF
jgi:hypothetical protein